MFVINLIEKRLWSYSQVVGICALNLVEHSSKERRGACSDRQCRPIERIEGA